MTVFRSYSTLFLCAFLVATAAGCTKKSSHRTVVVTGKTMGTTYAVKAVFPLAVAGVMETRLPDEIDRRLVSLNKTFSTYDPRSVLSGLNRTKVGKRFEINKDLESVLMISGEMHKVSDGMFEPTVGLLVDLWGFGPTKVTTPPSPRAISDALVNVGFQHLAFKDLVAVRKRDITIDLSAVAKGYAVDQIATILEMLDATGYMVEIGGEVRTAGRRDDGALWQIAIEAPDPGRRAVRHVLSLENAAVATSGDYRNFRDVDGRKISHTIDPRTGQPVARRLASVTVVHGNAAAADAWATALMASGLEAGLALAEEYYLPVLFLVHDDNGGIREYPTVKMKERFPDIFGAEAGQ